jgi:hypothetical protein
MSTKKAWMRLLLAMVFVAVIALGSGALGYSLGNRQPVSFDSDLLPVGGLPEEGDFANGPGGQMGGTVLGPRGGMFGGMLPWLLLSTVVLIGLAVALAKVLWPKPVEDPSSAPETTASKELGFKPEKK